MEVETVHCAPSLEDWRALERFLTQTSLTLEEFTKRYPHLSREQIARAAGCSAVTVNSWYCNRQSPQHRAPTKYHELRFGIAHLFWSQGVNHP
jgi:transcriptional regulator with XRE-family HTH domain